MFALNSILPVLFAAVASAQLTSKLTEITDFGPNPRNVSMFIYVPANLPPNPPILVSPHWCHGGIIPYTNCLRDIY